jgi:hypothetical protein
MERVKARSDVNDLAGQLDGIETGRRQVQDPDNDDNESIPSPSRMTEEGLYRGGRQLLGVRAQACSRRCVSQNPTYPDSRQRFRSSSFL